MDAKHNKCTFFPKEISQLTQLQTLDIRENYISPHHLKKLQNYLPNCTILTSDNKTKKENTKT